MYLFLLVEYSVSTIGIVVFRLVFRNTFLTLVKVGEGSQRKRTLLVGAGRAGRIIIKEVNNAALRDEVAQQYDIVGIVDDPQKIVIME